jgi:hypothetical protein
VPKGWIRVVTRGPGALTDNQCLRIADRYIYAAQFHIEMDGTPENSRRIMGNFLSLAKAWGGYNPKGTPVPGPSTAAGRTPDEAAGVARELPTLPNQFPTINTAPVAPGASSQMVTAATSWSQPLRLPNLVSSFSTSASTTGPPYKGGRRDDQ